MFRNDLGLIEQDDLDALGVTVKRVRRQVFGSRATGYADLAMYRLRTRKDHRLTTTRRPRRAGIVDDDVRCSLRAPGPRPGDPRLHHRLVAVATALLFLGPHVRDQVIRHASTNLHNLGDGRIGTLIGSAFVTDTGPIYVWLPGLVRAAGAGRAAVAQSSVLVAFAVGHIGASCWSPPA